MELYFLALLILIMAAALGSGYPVAFALPGAAIITIGLAAGAGYIFAGSTDAYFHSGGPSQWLSAGVTNLRGVYWEVERDTLIAIPLFIFMGIMLQRSKIAEDLLVTMAQLFGPVPGGLGISVVFVGALLAATTGIVGATVVAMGLISLPAMLRNNYSSPLATGTIAASGTLGQIIPPSIVLIILADQLASATDQASTARKLLHKDATGELSMPSVFDVASTSAGEMFLGAFVPGMLLVGLYMAYILIFAILRPKQAPAVPYEGKYDLGFVKNVAITLVPPLALIFLVLGSIIAGIATVNQAGAIGAAGAMIMASYRLPKGGKTLYYPAFLAIAAMVLVGVALANFDMNVKSIEDGTDRLGIALGVMATVLLLVALVWSGFRIFKIDNTLQGVMLETAKTTSLVFIILLGAAMLTAAFRAFGGEDLVKEFLLGLPGGFWTQFIIVMLVIFILGFFLDFIEIAVVVVPIVAPILLADPSANITAVWLGVMIGLNIQTSFLTPPFGFALFYLRGVAPAVVKTVQMYKGVIAFILLQISALAIVGLYPPLVNYLPNRVSFLSESSPPPRNPKLQLCLEDYVGQQLAESSATRDAIKLARGMDLSVLPKSLAKDLTEGFDQADLAVAKLNEAFDAAATVQEAAPAYRPMHGEVRAVEKQIRNIEAHVRDLETTISRMRDDSEAQKRAKLQSQLDLLVAEADALRATIPAEWAEKQAEFLKLTQAENKARSLYRRAADASYEGPEEVLAVLDANAAYAKLHVDLLALRQSIETLPEKEGEGVVKDFAKRVGDVEGAGDVKKALGKVRNALKSKTPDREKALAEYEKALKAYEAQLTWRQDAEAKLRPGIEAYLEGIRGTLGVRLQPRFTRDQALAMASCTAYHRDISLNF
ncbi:TRAP transporter, DctM subunit [Aliiroseovarius crassostreae]|uniref:C4-dicarboxylate ABC transporter permease n=1 Tax=Aliiroseovarius crassostreae TaxID=154981 RepID=A0A0P7ICU2_9RHOB|nr:TRAP transporter large permease subunit [Aliiroseovarius crassostreae]KPN61778.1 C4-dicarboxylate ABC transporter permease [Aliiroseovarius crassostreae]SFU46492.1 TRAP transporter, DctM subunit [Aliiroseovarius crassostreae]